MRTKRPDNAQNRGAALLLALGMLTLLSVLGAAYVMSLQIDTETAALRLMKVRALHASEAGVQYALGELLRAADPAAAVGDRRHEVGVYGPVRTSPQVIEMTAPLTDVTARAEVSVREAGGGAEPAGAEGAAVAAGIAPGEGRLFRITSEGTAGRRAGGRDFGRTTVRTVALVLLRPEGPQFVYWNSGPPPLEAAQTQ